MENTKEAFEKKMNMNFTITPDEFCMASANVMANSKAISKMLESNPLLALAFSAFAAELASELFDKEEKVDGR